LIELPTDSAVSVTFSVALLAVSLTPLPADFALLPADLARELVARLADRALRAGLAALRADLLALLPPEDFELPLEDLELPPEDLELPPEDLELPPDAARERLDPLLAAADGLLLSPLLLPEDFRLAARPLVAAERVLPDPEDPFDAVPDEDFPREDALPDPRCVVAAIVLNLPFRMRPPGTVLVGFGGR